MLPLLPYSLQTCVGVSIGRYYTLYFVCIDIVCHEAYLLFFSLFVHCLFNPDHFFTYIDLAFLSYTTSDALTNYTFSSVY